MTRWKAASIHLAISALIVVTVCAIVLTLWYPLELLRMSELDILIGIIAAVDLVAGPLLTLIVFKQGKPSLRFDLTVIGLIQAALLAYGVYTLALMRPVFLVGAIDRFNMVAANEVTADDLAQAKPPYNRLSWTGPQKVGAMLPDDAAQRMEIFDRAMGGHDLHTLPQYFVAFESVRESLLSRAQLVSTILPHVTAKERDALYRTGGEDVAKLRYLPIQGARGSALMLLDPASGEPVAPVAVDLWPTSTPQAAPQGQ